MSELKDSKGTILTKGDLIMVTIDTPVIKPVELVIFISSEEFVTKVDKDGTETTVKTNTVKYYPLTKEGLEVAKFDNSVTQESIHREQKYTLTNILPKHILKRTSNVLRGLSKDMYNQILAVIT